MAKEIVTTCDAAFAIKIKDCGDEHDGTVRTFTIRLDGEAWEVDLGGLHAEALLTLAQRGRKLDPGIRRQSTVAGLEKRVRNIPNAADEG